MSNKYKALSKNTLLFTLNNFGTKLISLLLIPLYTYVLSSEEYGKIDLVVSAVSLLVPVLTLNIQDAVLRFSLDKAEDKRDVVSIGLKQNFIGSALLGVALLIITRFDILKLESKYVAFLYVYFIFQGLYNSFSMYLKAADKVNVLLAGSLVNTLTSCGLNLLLLLVVKMGVNGYLIANVAGTALSIVIMLLFGGILKDFRFKSRKGLMKAMLQYSFPLIFNSIAWWINNASDKYVLTLFCGVAANGILAVAYKIPTILSTIQTIFYNAWSISAIKDFDKDDSDGFIGNIYTLYSCVSVMGCAGIMLLNIPLAKFLYAKEFFEAWRYVPFLLLGSVFNGLALFEGCLFTAVKKTKQVSYTTMAGAVVNFVANIIFIQTIGPIGVSIATMLGYFVTWIVRVFMARRIVRLKVDWRREIAAIVILTVQTFLALKRGLEWGQLLCVVALTVLYFKYIVEMCKKILGRFKKKKEEEERE